MKGRISIRFLLSVVTAGLGLISADPATAQTFTVLHTLTNSDGVYPYGGALTLFANRLYAATTHGGSSGYGSSGYGTVFSVNRDGTGVSTLHDFNYDDGAYPETGLPYQVTSCMGLQMEAAILVMEQYSPSTRMAQVLRPCIVSIGAATELIRIPWSYQATLCLGRRTMAVRAVVRCSPSTPMA